jgi:hypothetical protein
LNGSFIGRGTSFAMSPKATFPPSIKQSPEKVVSSAAKSLNGSELSPAKMMVNAKRLNGSEQSPAKMVVSAKSLKDSEQSPAKDVTSLAFEYLQGRNAALEEDLIKTYDERGNQKAMSLNLV